jgi:Kef-type K+ transport system membrane component KefB
MESMMTLLNTQLNSPYVLMMVISVLLFSGLFVGRILEKFKVPNITGYIIIGLVFGGLIVFTKQTAVIQTISIFLDIAIGFIAFSIGLELNLKQFKKRSKEIMMITLMQALFTMGITLVALYVIGLPFHIALVLGTIAIATEPGPILHITKKLKAHGNLTDTLVPLHGLEDTLSILLFGGAISYAVSVENGSNVTLLNLLDGPILELIFSTLIAITIGLIFKSVIKALKYEDSEKDIVILITSIVLVIVSISISHLGLNFFGYHIHLSYILTPMIVGITFANTSSDLAKKETERIVDLVESPMLILFFTFVGTEILVMLNTNVMPYSWYVIIGFVAAYVLFRFLGKILGSYVGGKLGHSTYEVRHYLGFCLIPQAQAAIGVAFIAQYQLGIPFGNLILAIVLLSTIINEIAGPISLRYALNTCHESAECRIIPLKEELTH